MHELLMIVLYTLAAGACIPLGGVLSAFGHLRPRWLETEMRHAVIAFGGGVLIAAVALVLVPEGKSYVGSDALAVVCVLSGGACVFAIERVLGARRRERPQFMAMLLDYVPESLALGGAFAVGAASAPLLAVFIGLQNIPEGFNAYRELKAVPGARRWHILGFMALMLPIGPLAGVIGWRYLGEYPALLGATMLIAAGGILYLVFQDIAPQARMRRHWAPPLAAVLGFGVGMLGQSLAG